MKNLLIKYKEQIVYIEALVYMFLITTVIFASIQSSIYFKFIPLTFILGIVGVYIFDKKLVTGIFGFCVSVCVLKLTFYRSFEYTLIYSLYLGFSIFLGELLGGFLKNMQSKSKSNKNPKSIIFALIVLILGLYINAVVNGNIFSFIRSENILNNYLRENYSEYNLEVIPERYIFGDNELYTFNVIGMDNRIYNMSVTSSENVIDGYIDLKIIKLTNEIKEKLKFIDLTKYEDFFIDVKYNSLENLTLYITNNKLDYDLNMLSKKADTILIEFLNKKGFENINKLIIINDDTIANIDKKYFHNLDYYINSLKEEVIID